MTSTRVPSPARAGPSRTRHRRLITHDGARGGAARRHAPVHGSNRDDDVRTASSSSSCPPDVRAMLSARYADAVRRAADDPFVCTRTPTASSTGGVPTTLRTNLGAPGGLGRPARGHSRGAGARHLLSSARCSVRGRGGDRGDRAGLGPISCACIWRSSRTTRAVASEAELWEAWWRRTLLLRPGAIGWRDGCVTDDGDESELHLPGCMQGSEEAPLTGMDSCERSCCSGSSSTGGGDGVTLDGG